MALYSQTIKVSVSQSFAYVLRHKPFRENSLLVDLFTETQGKVTCIARPAKKRGKVTRGVLEPFRYLQAGWSGRGDVFTLTQVDERGRHQLSAPQMLTALYFNELILRLTYPLYPLRELFLYYKNSLHALAKSNDACVVMNFELYLLYSLGHSLNFSHTSDTSEMILAGRYYRYTPELGLIQDQSGVSGILLSGQLIIALRQSLSSFSPQLLLELRAALDAIIRLLLAGKPLNSRKLLDL